MENHNFYWEIIYKWLFSIAMLVYQRVWFEMVWIFPYGSLLFQRTKTQQNITSVGPPGSLILGHAKAIFI